MTILPFPEIPMLISYHNEAFPVGIIQANSTVDITRWLCTKCIKCVYYSDVSNNGFYLEIEDDWGGFEGLTSFQTFTLRKDLLLPLNIDLLSMFQTVIDHGCYIHGMYNEKYIPSKWAYENTDYYHDFLVIGYDDTCFYSVGFVSDGRFKHFQIPIQNFLDSLHDMNSPNISVNFFNYNRGAIPKPNVEKMLSDLNIYISTAESSVDQTSNATSYGMAAIACLRDFFIDEVRDKGKTYIDKRYTRVLYEHKWVLSQLVKSFLEPDEQREFTTYADGILNKAKCIHMLGLKMGYTGNGKLIDRVEVLMNEIIEEEQRYIPELLKVLKDKYS